MRFIMSSQAHWILDARPSWKASRSQAKLIWSSTSSQSRQGFDAKPSLLVLDTMPRILDIKPNSGSFWCHAKLKQFLMPSQAQIGFSISSQAREVFDVKPSSNSSWCQAKLKWILDVKLRSWNSRLKPGFSGKEDSQVSVFSIIFYPPLTQE